MSEADREAFGSQGDESEAGGWLPVILAELTVVAFVFVGVAILVRGASGADPIDVHAAPKPSAVSLSELPSAMSDTYHYVAEHIAEFMAIPCFCGCQQTLRHRNLEDCFVTPDGDWDAHASGCGVCTAEAVAAKELLDTNTPIDAVRKTIIEGFGPPPSA